MWEGVNLNSKGHFQLNHVYFANNNASDVLEILLKQINFKKCSERLKKEFCEAAEEEEKAEILRKIFFSQKESWHGNTSNVDYTELIMNIMLKTQKLKLTWRIIYNKSARHLQDGPKTVPTAAGGPSSTVFFMWKWKFKISVKIDQGRLIENKAKTFLAIGWSSSPPKLNGGVLTGRTGLPGVWLWPRAKNFLFYFMLYFRLVSLAK